MAYYDFLNIAFAPLLKLPILWIVIIMALIVSVVIIVITKYTTNQSLMKSIKDEMKGHQKQIKEFRNEPSKAMEIQKKLMVLNKDYMMHSLRSTLFTFVPIILIFGWMSATFAYDGINPGQEFSVDTFFQKNTNGEVKLSVTEGLTILGSSTINIEDDKATWSLKGEQGEHILEFIYNGEQQQKSVLITTGQKYLDPDKKVRNSAIKNIRINHEKKKVLNLFGWRLGWLGTYIIFSIIFTMGLRKFMKVY